MLAPVSKPPQGQPDRVPSKAILLRIDCYSTIGPTFPQRKRGRFSASASLWGLFCCYVQGALLKVRASCDDAAEQRHFMPNPRTSLREPEKIENLVLRWSEHVIQNILSGTTSGPAIQHLEHRCPELARLPPWKGERCANRLPSSSLMPADYFNSRSGLWRRC